MRAKQIASMLGLCAVLNVSCQAFTPATPTPDIEQTVTAHVSSTVSALPTNTPHAVVRTITLTLPPTPAATAVPTAVPTPAAAPQTPLDLTGLGRKTTEPFVLIGGDYTIDWQVQDDPGDGQTCMTNGVLMSADNPNWFGETIMLNVAVPPGQARQGETHTYNRPRGRYYLRVSSSCQWHVTFKPIA